MPLTNVKTTVQISATVPVGTVPFDTVKNFIHQPNGSGSAVTVATSGAVAGQISDIYAANLTIASTGSPQTLILTALNDPTGSADGFLHIDTILIENTDLTNSVTVTPGVTHGVTWLPAAGITLGPGTAARSSKRLIEEPTGLAIVASTSDQITFTSSGGTNVVAKVTITGRNT